jgi:hypothetical protein
MAKTKIRLIATSITFTSHSIVYGVKFDDSITKSTSGIVVSLANIKHKDLILKTTIVDPDNMEVVFAVVNVTPHFYQAILHKVLRDFNEYTVELNSIYSVNEVVGYVIPY